jgi:hypothetical protein
MNPAAWRVQKSGADLVRQDAASWLTIPEWLVLQLSQCNFPA